MKTNEFLSLLQKNQNKSLLFQYRNGDLVGANYHITEVKNIIIDSVDCGSKTDYWKETVIQLWESPKEVGKTEYMSTRTALGILNKVQQLKPMVQEAEIKFEYGNSSFHAAQLYVNDIETSDDQMLVRLVADKTNCKAQESCGVPVEQSQEEETCCSPAEGCC